MGLGSIHHLRPHNKPKLILQKKKAQAYHNSAQPNHQPVGGARSTASSPPAVQAVPSLAPPSRLASSPPFPRSVQLRFARRSGYSLPRLLPPQPLSGIRFVGVEIGARG
jgi:hypothetical protein